MNYYWFYCNLVYVCENCSYLLVFHWIILNLSKINCVCGVFPYTFISWFLIIVGFSSYNLVALFQVIHYIEFYLQSNFSVLGLFFSCMGSMVLTFRVSIKNEKHKECVIVEWIGMPLSWINLNVYLITEIFIHLSHMNLHHGKWRE